MEMIPITVRIRGVDYELEAPGPDAPPELVLISNINMLILALIALENPDVDAVLSAFRFQIGTGDGQTIFPPGVDNPDAGNV